MRLHDYGDRAVLIETEHVLAVRDALLASADPGIAAVVPGARSVLVEFTGARFDLTDRLDLTDQQSVADQQGVADRLAAGPAARSEAEPLEIAVRYDGPDLAAVAEAGGLSPEEVIHRHSDREYTVQFCGFSPGFSYLTGLDERLRLPRRSSPRPRVPAGSVAIADEFTGVYPRSSPGGWQLLGRTDAVLFDLQRQPPALFTPGRRVRFIPQ